MDIGELLTRAARLTWRHKTLWWLGLLPGLTHVASALARLWLSSYARREFWPLLSGLSADKLPSLEQWLLRPEVSRAFFNGRFLLLLTGWLIVTAVIFWLVVTLAEAAIIAATLGIVNGRPVSPGHALTIGRRFLIRFIAIDALVFWPWFVVALAALVVMGVTVGATAVLTTQETTTTALFTSLGLGLGCAALLACLLMPLSFLSIRFRTLAFRDTAVVGGTVQQSLRHTWQVVRQHLGEVVILLLILWGLQYIFNLLLSLVSLPLGLVTAVPTLLSFTEAAGGTRTAVANFLGVSTAVLLAVPQALLFVYVGVVWTLAYLQWSEEP